MTTTERCDQLFRIGEIHVTVADCYRLNGNDRLARYYERQAQRLFDKAARLWCSGIEVAA